jgi:hypothetical protein
VNAAAILSPPIAGLCVSRPLPPFLLNSISRFANDSNVFFGILFRIAVDG